MPPLLSDLSATALNALTEVRLRRMEMENLGPSSSSRARNAARMALNHAMEYLAMVLYAEYNAAQLKVE